MDYIKKLDFKIIKHRADIGITSFRRCVEYMQRNQKIQKKKKSEIVLMTSLIKLQYTIKNSKVLTLLL